MQKTWNKLLSALLVLAMLLTLLPVQAFAQGTHVHETASSVATRSVSGGTYVIAANVGGVYYAIPKNFDMTSGKIKGVQITVTNGSVDSSLADVYGVTIAAYGSNFTIYNGSKYLKYSSGTNLATNTTPYEWSISTGTNGSYRITPATESTRGIIFRAGSYYQFGGYAVSNTTNNAAEYYDVELIPLSTSGEGGGTTETIVSTANVANGKYVVAANVGGTYYAMANTFASKITATAVTISNGSIGLNAASAYVVTIAKNGSFHTISNGTTYLGYSGSTNLSSSASAYDWAIVSGTNGTYRAIASSDNTRCLSMQVTDSAKRFGAYALSNVTAGSTSYYDIELIPVVDSGSVSTEIVIPDGNYVIAALYNGTYYAMDNYFDDKIEGEGITVENGCVTEEVAENFVVTIESGTNGYTIRNETGYLRQASGTSLGFDLVNPYEWKITSGLNGGYRITSKEGRVLSFRADTYFTFGCYAASNVTAGSESYFDVELLAIGDPADYVKETYTLVTSADQFTAGNYVIVSQAINSNRAYYALSASQEPGYYYMTSNALGTTERLEKITLNAKDIPNYVWTMTGTRTSFTLKNQNGQYLSNNSAAHLVVGTSSKTWAGSAYSTTKYGFHISSSGYYISLRDDLASYGANGNPMFGGTAVTTTPAGHIYMNMYKACPHTTLTTESMPATCLESGMYTQTCTACGEIVNWKSTPALGHSISYTANGDGTHEVFCSACDYNEGTANCVYSNLACYQCGSPEPENDYSGRYYFATVRGSAGSTYHYMTFDLIGTATKRYASEDSGLTELPSVITSPVSNKVYVIEKNEAGTYRIFAEGLAGDNCLAWEVDANASENSGAFADTFNAYELTIGLAGEATGGNKIVNIYFVENDLPRYLSLNNTNGNNYFAWYTSASSQRRDLVLIPVVGEATCLHTNRTTVTQDPTCTTAGVEMIYCADCGAVVGENELLASGHAFQYEWIEDGWHQVTCANCDYDTEEECTLIGDSCMYCSGGDLECFQLVTSLSDLTADRYVIIAQATNGAYLGDYSYYGIGLQQDSNYNGINSFGMNFDDLPTEIYLEGVDTANLVWTMKGNANGFTLSTDDAKALYHASGEDVFLGSYTASTWTAALDASEGFISMKHNGYYLALRTDLDTLEDTDVYAPLVKCVDNTDTGNYKFYFYKKYDGCLHVNTSTTIVEPTCTTGGSEKVVCLDCGATVTYETLPAYGHDPFAYEATEATCTESGNKEYWYCADCDCYFADELCTKKTTQEALAIPATGHSWDDGQIIASPTCTTTGSMLYTCYVCTTTKTETIAASGHFYTRVVTPPTCTAQGYTTHTCLGCGDSYISNYTPAFGHDYTYTNNGNGTHSVSCARVCGYAATEQCVFVDGKCVCGATGQQTCAHTNKQTTTVNATCTTSGSVTVSCKDCGVTISTSTLPATGHSYQSVVTAPTCTAQGYTTYTCSSCGNSYKSNYVGATGHAYTTLLVAPTCYDQGYTKYTCTTCGYDYNTNYIAAVGHSYTYTNNNNGTHTVRCINGCGYSATVNCTYTNGKCVCGAAEPVSCTHANKETVTVAATCTTAGSVTVTCASCGEVLSTTSIAATGHSLIEVAAKDATCTEDGCNKHWACTSCKGYFADANGKYALPESFIIIAATGHNYVGGYCLNCGASTAPTYVYNSNLTMTMSVSIGAEMQVLYTVVNAKIKNYDRFYVEVVKDVYNDESVVSEFSLEKGNIEPKYLNGNLVGYNVVYTGIVASEMGDNFTAKLYAVASDGTIYYGTALTSSIKSSLMEMINDSTKSAQLRTLAVDMLNYGAAAQLFFDYNTANPANADLTAAQKALGTQTLPKAVNSTATSGTGVNITPNVSLKSKVLLYVTCRYTSNENSDLTFIIKDQNGMILEAVEPNLNTGVACRGLYDNVGAAHMRELLTIELYDNGVLVSKKLTWSIESYVASVRADSTSSVELINAVNAMLVYGDSAAAYLASTGQ